MNTSVHPTAILEEGVEIGVDVVIGPHSFIEAGTRIGDGTTIGAQASIGREAVIGSHNRIGPKIHISGLTTIGDRNMIFGQASLGTAPQDLSYRDENTRLVIGSGNTIREFVTINRGTIKGGGYTNVGDDCLLMACCHVAHDCEIGSGVILGNNVLLAGHVKVEDRANIAGGSVAHHFVTVGTLAYVGGVTRMPQDVPPYMIFEGNRPRVRGVNVVGLQRAGVEKSSIQALRETFKAIYRNRDKERPRDELLDALTANHGELPEVRHFVESLHRTELGPKGRFRETLREQFMAEGRERILGDAAALDAGAEPGA